MYRTGDTGRLLARIMLVALLFTAFTSCAPFSEEPQRGAASGHVDGFHMHPSPQLLDDDAVTPAPELPGEPMVVRIADIHPAAPPRPPVFSLDHPPD